MTGTETGQHGDDSTTQTDQVTTQVGPFPKRGPTDNACVIIPQQKPVLFRERPPTAI